MKKTTSTVVFTRLCPLAAIALLLSTAPAVLAQETDTWTGNDSPGNPNWNDANNWSDALSAAPSPYDSLIFSGSNTGNNNNFIAGTPFDGISFAGSSPFNLIGNSILLSGNVSGISNGIVNNSSVIQAMSLNLNLDWGYYTMVGGPGLDLNDTLTLNAGGVAFFAPNVTNISLTSDSGGLIAGLGGAGLMYSTSTATFPGTAIPTGLATVDVNGGISAYNYSTDPNAVVLASGTIPNGANDNVELTGTGTYTWPSGTTYLNTILATTSGTATSVQASPTNAASVLVLGTNNNGSGPYIGAILAPNVAAGKSSAFTLGVNAQTLTAGPMSGPTTPGTIVVAVNGTNNGGNQAFISPKIVNNGSGGAVTLVFTGNGNVNVNSGANTYTGGTYIDSGTVQFGGPAPASSASSCGTGPIYVASSATAYFNVLNSGISTIANNFYLSPGQGALSSVLLEPSPPLYQGALSYAAAFAYSGTMTLLSNAVTVASGPGGLPQSIGCRLTAQAAVNATITGQITGTGTLDLTGAHSSTVLLENPITSGLGTNNFSGGVILDAPAGHGVSMDIQMGANNQLAGGNVTILAPGTTATGERFDLNGTKQTIGALNGTVQSGVSQGYITNQVLVTNSAASTAATLIMGANNQNGCYEGITPDRAAAPLNFVKVGTGTQEFDQTISSPATMNLQFHGSLTVQSGVVQLLANSTVPNAAALVLYSGGTLDASQANPTVNPIVGSVFGNGIDISNQMLIGTGSLLGYTVITNGASIITTNPASGAIGTLNLNTSFGAGSEINWSGNNTYVWDINNATGTAGSDPGWSLINLPDQNELILYASQLAPITIAITALNSSDQPGSAANFNSGMNQAWMILSSQTPIQDFNAADFVINISAAQNLGVAGAGAFTVANTYGSDTTGDNLYLVYTAAPVIQTELASQAANQGGTVSYTVAANGTGISYTWYEDGNQLVNDGTSAGGATVTIATNNGANSGTSTLTLAGVGGADSGDDIISVEVTSSVGSGESEASLTVTTPASSISESSSLGNQLPNTPLDQGAAVVLTAQAFGQQNNTFLTYQWYLNGQAITGATNASYAAPYTTSTGSYTVSATDNAGSYTNTTPQLVGGATTYVPNQMIFEPFNYIFQTHDAAVLWDAISPGATNVYNQHTGVGLAWVASIGGDMDCEYPNWNQHYAELPPAPYGYFPDNNWPWEGLAGSYPTNDFTVPGSDGLYTDTGHNSDVHLTFGPGGSISNGPVYLSFVVNMGAGSAITTASYDYVAGFGFDNGDPTTVSGIRNAGIYLETPGDDSYRLGVFKINTSVAATSLGTVLTNGVNGGWASSIPLYRDVTLFVVCRLTVNPSGGSSVAMWIDPPTNTYYVSEANVPTPDVPDSDSASAPDVASPATADYFYLKNTATIPSRTFADLHIGTTWASVTPPAAPTLSVNNVALTACPGSTAVFTSQNAGNPVTQGYGWTFNNSPLTDTTLADGAQIIGSSTSALTVVNPTVAEAGAYTVTGTNLDQNSGNPVAGSATGTLSFLQPPLNIVYANGNVTLSWPTSNGQCYTLEQTSSLSPSNWATIAGPYPVIGTNYVVSMAAPANPMYYQLVATP